MREGNGIHPGALTRDPYQSCFCYPPCHLLLLDQVNQNLLQGMSSISNFAHIMCQHSDQALQPVPNPDHIEIPLLNPGV